jgi:FAD/FMN-containing dehydrogenase
MHHYCDSWGRTQGQIHKVFHPDLTSDLATLWTSDQWPAPYLAHGMGRSYGDSCLNEAGTLVKTQRWDRLVSFDRQQGRITCEAGMSLAEILDVIVPAGWFLPVTPGTKYVSVGGAIANDVHGKNHHLRGTLGRHVLDMVLARSDSKPMVCSPEANHELFHATIGGLGLTGIITQATIQLIPIVSPLIRVETLKFRNLEEFFELSTESDREYEYTVAWIDCMASGKDLGRGHLIRGDHATTPKPDRLAAPLPEPMLSIPMEAPSWFLNSWSIRAFNELYYRRQRGPHHQDWTHFEPFFYPLDKIRNWNRLYGKPGFYQYQCVTPIDDKEALNEIFATIQRSKLGSFLGVLKQFGDIASPGLLSFPQPGYTLALDFANRGAKTLRLFETLDQIVSRAGGRVYPAKDACMSAATFQAGFPHWQKLVPWLDPHCSSNFWRRVTS